MANATHAVDLASELDDAYAYIAVLERNVVEQAAEVTTLRVVNNSLKRSIGAYKANSTRRRAQMASEVGQAL